MQHLAAAAAQARGRTGIIKKAKRFLNHSSLPKIHRHCHATLAMTVSDFSSASAVIHYINLFQLSCCSNKTSA